jgi:hypothetical protein
MEVDFEKNDPLYADLTYPSFRVHLTTPCMYQHDQKLYIKKFTNSFMRCFLAAPPDSSRYQKCQTPEDSLIGGPLHQ